MCAAVWLLPTLACEWAAHEPFSLMGLFPWLYHAPHSPASVSISQPTVHPGSPVSPSSNSPSPQNSSGAPAASLPHPGPVRASALQKKSCLLCEQCLPSQDSRRGNVCVKHAAQSLGLQQSEAKQRPLDSARYPSESPRFPKVQLLFLLLFLFFLEWHIIPTVPRKALLLLHYWYVPFYHHFSLHSLTHRKPFSCASCVSFVCVLAKCMLLLNVHVLFNY